MGGRTGAPRSVEIVVTLLVLGGTSALLFLLFQSAPFGQGDLFVFWAAAQLFFAGENPYNPALVANLARSMDPPVPASPLFWNPPGLFSVIWPFALVDFSTLRPLFSMATVGLTLAALDLEGVRFKAGGSASGRMLLVTLTFYPLFLALENGQLSPLLLAAFSGSLYFSKRGARGRAGLILSVLLVKPQLLYLPLAAALVRAVRERDGRFIGAFLLGGVALQTLPLALRPDIYRHFCEIFERLPTYWLQPNINTWIALALERRSETLHLLPTVAAGVLVLWRSFTRRSAEWERFYRTLIPLSLLTAPYVWLYDFVLLLPAIVDPVHERRRLLRAGIDALLCVVSGAPYGLHRYLAP
jgi:hypothetical protein